MPDIPRVALCCLPTPLHRLNALSDQLQIDLWIKRDDLTGFAGGGNKGRKLEYLMPVLLQDQPDVIVTNGSSQSNFVRMLGAACALAKVECHAVIMDLPHPDGHPTIKTPASKGGNLPLDDLFGVHLIKLPNGPWSTLEIEAEKHAENLRNQGKKVTMAKLGGSSPQGVHAYREAIREVKQDFDHIIVPCSSGSTYVGLASAANCPVIGISCDNEPEMIDDLMDLWLASYQANLAPPPDRAKLDFRLNWVGEGYGIASESGIEAALLMARHEGIILESTYTAKAFAGLVELARRKEITGQVLFWHTGGLPGACAATH